MTAAGRAAEFVERGFRNSEVLLGGVDAWQRAGFAIVKPPSILARLRSLVRRTPAP